MLSPRLLHSAFFCSCLLLLDLAFGGNAVAEHPMSITETQIFVTKTRARARITLFAEDLKLFHGLELNELDMLPADEIRRGIELHKDFLKEKVRLLNELGEAYPATVTDVQLFDIPEAGVFENELMLHSLTYEFEFRFEKPPEFLTIQQDISDPNFIIPSEMDLTLHQAGTEMTYTKKLKPGAADTIRFDWSDDALREDASDEEWREWFEKQREATLGIISYSSVYSFVYIEPAEVRHEVLLPLSNLKKILPFVHADPAFIAVDEQPAVQELIRKWMADANPAKVNGEPVDVEFTLIEFFGLDRKDFAKPGEARKVSLASGRVGVIMTYRPAGDIVRDVELTWDLFPSDVVRKIDSVIISYPNNLDRFEFSKFNKPEENIFRWTAPKDALPPAAEPLAVTLSPPPPMQVPVGTIALGLFALVVQLFSGFSFSRIALATAFLAAVMLPFAQIETKNPFAANPPLTEEQSRDVFESLHQGAYSALDFGTESRIYDALETTVDGDLLESLYLQLRESLAEKEQGGAIGRVQEIAYLHDEPLVIAGTELAYPGYRYRGRWTVRGTVEHWGHIHERVNRFSAVFNVEPRSGFWKLTDMRIENQEPVSSKAGLRSF